MRQVSSGNPAHGTITPWVVQIDKLGQAQAVAPAVADYRPTDPQIAWHLAHFIEEVRSIPADPIVLRQNWLDAYNFVTDKGARALGDFARASDPFTKVGKEEIAIEVSSVIRASDDSFRVGGDRTPPCRLRPRLDRTLECHSYARPRHPARLRAP